MLPVTMATLMSLSPSNELTDCGVHIAMLWPLRTKRTLHFVFPGVLVQINKMQEMQRYCNLCTLLKLKLLH